MTGFWRRQYGKVEMIGYAVPAEEVHAAVATAEERGGWHLDKMQLKGRECRLTFWRPVRKKSLFWERIK